MKSREYLLRQVCAPGTVHAGGTVIDKLTVSGGHEVCKDGTTAYCNFIMSEGARYPKRKNKNLRKPVKALQKRNLASRRCCSCGLNQMISGGKPASPSVAWGPQFSHTDSRKPERR